MSQLGSPLPRATFWVVVLLLLAGALVTVGGAQAASSTNYVLTGYARTSLGQGISGTVVDLQSRATGQIFTTAVNTTGGKFTFSTSSTSGALVPGYWSLWVPAQTNVSYGGNCGSKTGLCAILPVNQTPYSSYLNVTDLTTTTYSPILTISIVTYSGTIKGTVMESGSPLISPQATVQLLDPGFNDLSLGNNTTNASGYYAIAAPPGNWVLETIVPGAPPSYNMTQVTVTKGKTLTVDPNIQNYLVYGTIDQLSGSPVPTAGNVTVYDPSTGYIFSTPTTGGGFYSFGDYNFTAPATQSFNVILSSIGYATTTYTLQVTGPNQVQRIVRVPAVQTSQRGSYTTTLDFATINPATGKGSVSVNTSAYLGNNTVFANLPNVTVGQMWAQLGLDFAHTLPFPESDLSAFFDWENASGPFFPAIQAGLTFNGTGFINPSPTQPQPLTSFTTTGCPSGCGLATAGDISLGWNTTYQLNGTVGSNSSAYTVSFGFAHPLAADAYNYTVVLPAGYSLAAGTAAPANTKLVPLGVDNTWTSFTLQSLPSTSPQGTASFSIVKYSNMTANVNITSKSFYYSSANVLNATHNNYTVVVGVGENVTFSALNSTYPSGTNGTKFAWTFGDGGTSTVGTATTNHTYHTASGRSPYNGTLIVTSSGGLVNNTTFYVWVGNGPVNAVITNNASSSSNRTAGPQPYMYLNWGTTVQFNATGSYANISSTAPISNVLTIAKFTITAKGYSKIENYTTATGASVDSNFTYTFLGAGVYYKNNTVINGTTVYFKGWRYNVTLGIWSGSGQLGVRYLVVLVNDTQPPTPAFQVLNSALRPAGGSGVITGSNLTARIYLNAANSTDPNNGSLTRYYWQISNSGNSSVYKATNVTTVKPYPSYWLTPQTKPYTINLTVYDLNGNRAWTNTSLQVSVNSTTTPIMVAANFTAATTYNAGTSYTIWVNLTAKGGSKSTATDVTVSFYFTTTTGTTRNFIGGSPASVQFWAYNSTGFINTTTPFATGSVASMAYGTTYRALIHWTPSATGNWRLYANVTAGNGYIGNYASGVVSQSITVNPSPTTQLLEYAAVAIVVVVVIVLLIVFYRRRTGRSGTARSGGRSSASKSKSSSDEDDDLDDES